MCKAYQKYMQVCTLTHASKVNHHRTNYPPSIPPVAKWEPWLLKAMQATVSVWPSSKLVPSDPSVLSNAS